MSIADAIGLFAALSALAGTIFALIRALKTDKTTSQLGTFEGIRAIVAQAVEAQDRLNDNLEADNTTQRTVNQNQAKEIKFLLGQLQKAVTRTDVAARENSDCKRENISLTQQLIACRREIVRLQSILDRNGFNGV